MSARWQSIPDFAGYEVSDLGEIRSHRPWRGIPAPRVLQLRESRGYLVVGLIQNGRKVKRQVHRLMGETFLGPLPDGMVTRHLNGDPLDNRLTNLAYGTNLENNLDTVAHGRHPEAIKTHCVMGHPFDGDNLTWSVNATGRPRRRCVTCDRARWNAYNKKRRAA